MTNVINFPFNNYSLIECIDENISLVDLSYKNLSKTKEQYKKLRNIRSKYRYRDINTGDIIRTKGYLKVLRLRTNVKKIMYDLLICLSDSLTNVIIGFIVYSDKLYKNKIINEFNFKYLKKLISCLIKKLSFILKRCSEYNNKRIYKIKTSNKSTLKHCMKVYSYQDRINKINKSLNLILPYYGSIDDIKISNRKNYIKEIYSVLEKTYTNAY